MRSDSTSQLVQVKSGNRRTHWVEHKQCAWCGVDMFRTPDVEPWRFARNRTCSPECAEKSRRANNPRRLPDASKACAICGIFFSRSGRDAKSWTSVKVCSEECKHALIGLSKRVDRREIEPKPCAYCGFDMECRDDEDPSQFKKRECCSAECASVYRGAKRRAGRGEIDPRPCEVCGEMIQPRTRDYPSTYALRKTCSGTCHRRYRWRSKDEWRASAVKACVICGCDFMPHEDEPRCSFVRRLACGVQCGRELAGYLRWQKNHPGETYSGRASAYPREWSTDLRDRVIRRDRHKCQMCGAAENFHIHHIDYDKQNCDLTNLITLCRKCHGRTSRANREVWTEICRGFLKVRGIL